MENSLKYNQNFNIKRKSKIDVFLFICFYINLLLTGILPQPVVSITFLILASILTFRNQPHLIFPTLVFYYTHLDKIIGISTFRLYTFVFLIFLIVKNTRKIFLDKKCLYILIIYVLYCILALMRNDIQKGFFAIYDVIFIMVLLKNFISSEESFKSFFKHYAIVAILAFVTGVVTKNVLDASMETGKTFIDFKRYMSTFNDPNYMGFFYTIAVFSLICLKLYSKWLRLFFVITIYIMIISTASMTAIFVNLMLWLIYLLFRKNKKIYQIVIVAFCALGVLILYNYALNNDLGFITTTAIRLNEKIKMLNSNDIDGFTTGRTSLAEQHWNYYIQQPVYKILIGGNLCNGQILDLPPEVNFSGHNEYIDLLLNVGLIGTIILLMHPISHMLHYYKEYVRTTKSIYLAKAFIKMIWLIYAVTLTVFLDMRFFLFFLL